MNCPQCNASTQVLETRAGVVRRRCCKSCGHRFVTVEVLRERLPDRLVPRIPPPKPARRPQQEPAGRPAVRHAPTAPDPLPPPSTRALINDLMIDRQAADDADWWG